jgi:hypothetical protein
MSQQRNDYGLPREVAEAAGLDFIEDCTGDGGGNWVGIQQPDGTVKDVELPCFGCMGEHEYRGPGMTFNEYRAKHGMPPLAPPLPGREVPSPPKRSSWWRRRRANP